MHPVVALGTVHLHVHLAMELDDLPTPASADPESERLGAACEPVVHDDERIRLLWLMAEYFRAIGYTDIKARLPGYVPPPVLAGTLEDHRPDFTCRQSDVSRTPIILEVVTPANVTNPDSESRWSLLGSAARLYEAELHFVIPRWCEAGIIDPILKRRLQRMELVSNRIWTV